ncbi:hypothetical protein [Fuscovulum ytuae]|uniref:Uncharacterized protein n=1 Tax=Fuscovulum ytuae TaxID=3042299 RepID=A0ABY8Q8G7_9RHOB|nr:hypothetical protein [Fuscovulum sp. YMD61]WGV16502.1 hypothetical protein QF092_01415 [Fuscovulum sp. YMD61]
MPKLVRLYIQSIAVGFALSVLFLGALLWLDIGGLGGLILGSSTGFVAAAMLIVFNGIIFSGAQFAYVIMRMADHDDGPRGGRAVRLEPIPVKVAAQKTPVKRALRR